MEPQHLTGKNEGELQRMLKAEREKLRDLRFRISGGQVKDVRELRLVRKTIARILTTLNAGKRGKAPSSVPAPPKPQKQ